MKTIFKLQELKFYLIFITFSKSPPFSCMQASTLLQKLAMTAMRINSFTLWIASVADDLTSCSDLA